MPPTKEKEDASKATGTPKDKKMEPKADIKKAAPPPPPTPSEVLQKNIFLLDKYAETKDARFLSRALRYCNFLRAHLSLPVLRSTAETYVTDPTRKSHLEGLFDAVSSVRKEPAPIASPATSQAADGDIEMKGTQNNALSPSAVATKTSKVGASSVCEIEVFTSILLLSMLAGAKAYQPLAAASLSLIDYIAVLNRRTLDFFQARAYHFLSLAQEKLGSLAAIRAVLVSAHRTATLRHDEYGQAVLINLLLRNFLSYKLYDQANKLVQKASFPEAASNNQLVRYLYYKGRIQAVQLEYSESFASLTQALRKAPQAAVSFRAQVQQFAVIVQLLTGEIPERAVFHADKSLAPFLKAYYELTFAVRSGELPVFARALSAHAAEFEKDDTYNLILRLQANVIKTGLRSIATSYSRISFASIASKLELGTAADAECLCAKAIRDGVIDGVLDHETSSLISREVSNVYGTKEPQEAYHRRITFCLDVHNEAIKAMRYPPNSRRKDLEDAEERAARDEEELDLDDLEDDDM